MTDTIAAIEVERLSFSYPDGHEALRDVSLSVAQGEKVAMVGPNGAGKSTLMLHLNGILSGKGRVRVCGLDVVKEHLGRVRDRVEERYGRWAVEELGLDDDAAREWAGMFAQAILSVLQGWVVQSCLLPGFDHGAYLDYARTLAAQ